MLTYTQQINICNVTEKKSQETVKLNTEHNYLHAKLHLKALKF